MEKYIGRIWLSLLILGVFVVIWLSGDSLKTLQPKMDNGPFSIALTQLGIMYIIALFVERSLEVLIKVWRQGGKVHLEQEKNSDQNGAKVKKQLEEYRAGTQKRALIGGLTMGVLVSLSGVRLLGPIFQVEVTNELEFQQAIFNFTDIVITAGLIAGGSKTIHELMALIDGFLKASRSANKS
ncbi:MAG: hypothetical protein F4201_01645 [Nitrospira sp. SB0677_bin_15]|nr:hypothetical protein [Nitrospira sp. SB0667_bin_9]MYD30857.1 hypothetical protein [Nitrospira sp. SB0661_bin_20]MYG39520.1 hypothetical protein [Nitrospira sp. SB0677_bin_15]MYH01562.1 hypothetical protein [Nitrospira sp. SB0675_bin_23]MYJ23948.1 hypothetical protein [Nitrospira sp. SB0673_bin_12]